MMRLPLDFEFQYQRRGFGPLPARMVLPAKFIPPTPLILFFILSSRQDVKFLRLYTITLRAAAESMHSHRIAIDEDV